MPATIKPSGPVGSKRPFMPKIDVEDPAQRIAHALENIAVSLAAIDHNLEVLVARTTGGRGGRGA